MAERFGVSQAYVSRVRSRHERLGQASAGAQHNHVPLRLAGLKAPLLAPEQTLVQLCQWVRAERAIEVGPTAMGLQRLADFRLDAADALGIQTGHGAMALGRRLMLDPFELGVCQALA